MKTDHGQDLSEYLQSEDGECGLMCVTAAASILGHSLSAAEARRNFGGSIRGASLSRLCDIATNLNMTTSAVSCSFEELGELVIPSILHWNEDHFVVLLGVKRAKAQLFDPASGYRSLPFDQVARAFSGSAIQLTKSVDFRPAKRKASTSLLPMFAITAAIRGKIAQMIGLSLLVQTMALLLPLLMQLAINQGAMEGEVAAVSVVAGALGLVYGANFMVELWRSGINQRVAAHMTQITARSLFRHLMSIPMPWVERRSVADLATRFDSIEPLRNALSTGLVTVLVDGTLGLLLSIALIYMSPLLGGIVIASALLSIACKACLSPLLSRYSSEAAAQRVFEQSKRWETVRGLQALKMAGAESVRERDWASRMNQQVAMLEKSQGVISLQQSASSLVSGLGGVLVIYAGAVMVSAGELSIGGLFAFVMYRRYLSDKVSAAFDQVNSFWMLRVHLARVFEVLETESEPRWNDVRVTGEYIGKGEIGLKNVNFRRTSTDPLILSAVNLQVPAGGLIIINGPSGSGKSTLLKLLAGLYVPSSGEIHFDGVPQSAISPRLLREHIGAVMQEDELFSGSIFENVTVFSESPSLERCIDALEASEMWNEVKRLPMGVHTIVGEGGRSLSAGQRQRILLARALYRRPKILLLDEATSNVDPSLEQRIFTRLRLLKSTKIIISHHQAINSFADKVILLDERGLRVAERRVIEEVS